MRDEARALERDARGQLASAQDGGAGASPGGGCHLRRVGRGRARRRRLRHHRHRRGDPGGDPIALVALARSPRAVLAGDPHQLPPTVLDVDAARRRAGCHRVRARSRPAPSLLVTQHRMHRDIMAFPSESKYGGLLRGRAGGGRAHARGARRGARLRCGPGRWSSSTPPGPGWGEERAGDDPSTANPAMAARTAAEVAPAARRAGWRRARSPSSPPTWPRCGSCATRSRGELAAGLEIDTVDGFQGREKEAVVVDLGPLERRRRDSVSWPTPGG